MRSGIPLGTSPLSERHGANAPFSSALGGSASALAKRDWQRYRVAYLGGTPPCGTVEPCAGIRDWRVHATSLEE